MNDRRRGSCYRETFTKPVPAGAEAFTRKALADDGTGRRVQKTFLRWRTRRGQVQTGELVTDAAGVERVRIAAATYSIVYRDEHGRRRKEATGCADKANAERLLRSRLDRIERIRAGVYTPDELDAGEHLTSPIEDHVRDYLSALRLHRGRGQRARVSEHYLRNQAQRLRATIAACRFRTLKDVTAAAMARWMDAERKRATDADDIGGGTRGTLSARSLNDRAGAMRAFCNWCLDEGRLIVNPLRRMPRVAVTSRDIRHQRRAFTDAELRRLLKVAQLRPLAEYGRVPRPLDASAAEANRKARGATTRKTWTLEPLTIDTIDAAAARARRTLADRPEFIAELVRRGRERALIYKVLVTTGLRRGELASLTVGQAVLDGPRAFLRLEAAASKNGKEARIPLTPSVAGDLREWIADRLAIARGEAIAAGDTIPAFLNPRLPLLTVPAALGQVLNRDLPVALIAKRDREGRVVDAHALRHTFGTNLSRMGVAPRKAMAAMRHSRLELTMAVYTDEAALGWEDEIASMPDLPLNPDSNAKPPIRATGTASNPPVTSAPLLGTKPVQSGHSGAFAGIHRGTASDAFDAVNTTADSAWEQLSAAVLKRVKGLEPSTFTLAMGEEGADSDSGEDAETTGNVGDSAPAEASLDRASPNARATAWNETADRVRDAHDPRIVAALAGLLSRLATLATVEPLPGVGTGEATAGT